MKILIVFIIILIISIYINYDLKYNDNFQILQLSSNKINQDILYEKYPIIIEDKINDMEFIDGELVRNRYYSVNHRPEIREYAESFSWTKVVEKYYVPAMEKIISQ